MVICPEIECVPFRVLFPGVFVLLQGAVLVVTLAVSNQVVQLSAALLAVGVFLSMPWLVDLRSEKTVA